MDYSTFPDAWAGKMEAEVVDLTGVERLRSALELWGSGLPYPPGFDAILNDYEHMLRRLDAQLNASVVATR